MAMFPMYVDLKGKQCLIVGGGEVAYRKAEILLRFEAVITVIAPELCSSIIDLEEQGYLEIQKSTYSKDYIEGAYLVVAATSSTEVNELVYNDALKNNIPVNVVDDPEKCTFIFPSVVKRGPLTIGISTSGAYPALSKKIRKISEEIFPEAYSEMVEMLADFRRWVRKSSLTQPEKENVLRIVLEEFYSKGEITAPALKAILQQHEMKILQQHEVKILQQQEKTVLQQHEVR